MKKIWGNISYLFAKFIDGFMSMLLYVTEVITKMANIIKSILFFTLILFFLIFAIFPFLFVLIIPIFIIFIAFWYISSLGKVATNKLKKTKYIITNYYYDYANFYRLNQKRNRSFREYEKEYDDELDRQFEEMRKKEEEERRKRQEAENERWKEFFESNFGGFSQGQYGSYTNGNYQNNQSYSPFSNFKTQYENSCDVLGVNYNSSFNDIKSAYRKLAKKYHPDLSSEKNAEEMFKKINNAFDFLSEENVNRYKNL